MKRQMIVSLVAIAMFALIGANSAKAESISIFNGDGCCEKACCDPCDPCCRRTPIRDGLRNLFNNRCCEPKCCEPKCCKPKCCKPKCCKPKCCKPKCCKPVCCDPCDPCCKKRPIRDGLKKLFSSRCCKNDCCETECCDGGVVVDAAAPAPAPMQ